MLFVPLAELGRREGENDEIPHLPDALSRDGLKGGATRSGEKYLLQDDDEETSSDGDPALTKRQSHQTSQRKGRRARSRDVASTTIPVVPDTQAGGRALRSVSASSIATVRCGASETSSTIHRAGNRSASARAEDCFIIRTCELWRERRVGSPAKQPHTRESFQSRSRTLVMREPCCPLGPHMKTAPVPRNKQVSHWHCSLPESWDWQALGVLGRKSWLTEV